MITYASRFFIPETLYNSFLMLLEIYQEDVVSKCDNETFRRVKLDTKMSANDHLHKEAYTMQRKKEGYNDCGRGILRYR